MGSLTTRAGYILVLALVVCSVLLPTPKFDDDCFIPASGFDVADTTHQLKAIARNDKRAASAIHYDQIVIESTTPASAEVPAFLTLDCAEHIDVSDAALLESISLPLRS
jgi:hypothetical protein